MNYIIVDDEPLARKAIVMLAEKFPEFNLAGEFNSAASASEYLKDNHADLIFLDINMPGMNGMDFAKGLVDKTLIVFTTAYSEYAAESYEVDALDYLIKPIEPKRFAHAIEKALVYYDTIATAGDDNENETTGIPCGADFFFVKVDRRNCRVNFRDIQYVEGLKDYCILQLPDRRMITRMNLAAISSLLPAGKFLRVSKSYIVNLDHIDSFDSNDIYIADHVVPIGATYRTKLTARLLGQS